MAALPAVVAQEPAPAPEGVMISTRAFINGKEVAPEEVQKLIKARIVRALAGEAPKDAAPCCPNPDCTCGPAPKPCECKPGAVCGPKTAPEPPAAPAAEPAPAPAPEPAPAPAPAPAPDAAPCCPNPDCTCGPAPKPCECKPGAVCGPKTAPAPAGDKPTCDKPKCAKPACGKPACTKPATPGVMRVFINGKEVKPAAVPAVRVKPGCKAPAPGCKAPAPICTKCGKPAKVRPAKAPRPVVVPPCGRTTFIGEPAPDAAPTIIRRHGQVIKPAVRVRRIERPAAPAPAPAAESPKAVRVIINGVEAVVPVKPEGVNITIKPL